MAQIEGLEEPYLSHITNTMNYVIEARADARRRRVRLHRRTGDRPGKKQAQVDDLYLRNAKLLDQ